MKTIRVIVVFWMAIAMMGWAKAQLVEEWVSNVTIHDPLQNFEIMGLASDGRGNVFIGYKYSDTSPRFAIKKIDGYGVTLWNWSISGALADLLLGINVLKCDAVGNLIVGIGSYYLPTGYKTIKFDPNGNILWQHSLDTTVVRGSNGGPYLDQSGNIVCISTNASGVMQMHKLDPNGNLLANTTFPGLRPSGNYQMSFWGPDSMQFYGNFDLNFNSSLYDLVITDPSCNRIRTMMIDGNSVGYGIGYAHDHRSLWAIIHYPGLRMKKFDEFGVVVWDRNINTVIAASSEIVQSSPSGDIFVCGRTANSGMYLARIDSFGTHLSTGVIDIPDAFDEMPLEMQRVSDSQFLLIGRANNSSPLIQYKFPWVALVDTGGNLLDYLVNPTLDGNFDKFKVTEIDSTGHFWIALEGGNDYDLTRTLKLWKICVGECGGNISGSVWYDPDHDCVIDTLEHLYPWVPIRLQPGNSYTLTDANGFWERSVGAGTWSVSTPLSFPWANACGPMVRSVISPGTLGWQQDSIDFAMYGAISVFDLNVALRPAVARPGQTQHVTLYCSNFGTITSNGYLSMVFDSSFSYNNASPVPDSVVGDTVYWSVGPLMPYVIDTIRVDLDVPTTAVIGSTYLHSAEITPIIGDIQPQNNVDVFQWFIRGAFDPNEKIVNPGGVTGLIDSSRKDLSYTINFQNTGTDTAFKVIVKDTINPTFFDLSTFVMGPASHAFRLTLTNDSVFTWFFENILLPDNFVNEPLSHGFLRYNIQRRQLLDPDAFFCNRASIFFDFNLPVLTNNACLHVDNALAAEPSQEENSLSLHPNPADVEVIVNGLDPRWKNIRFALCDVWGKVILVGEKKVEQRNLRLKTEALKNGIYFLSITNGMATRTGKLVVLHP